jgi:hypothetical protein
MRLKFNNIEVEGKDKAEIEWLLQRVKDLEAERGINPSTSGEGAGRGRRESFIDFPKGRFTVAGLAEDLGISSATIYQRLKRMETNGDAKIVGEQRNEGQRGRATAIWQVINPQNQLKSGEMVGNASTKFDVDLDEPPE